MFATRMAPPTPAYNAAMKALVAQKYGGPEVLELVERDEPTVGADDVLIAVRAASLNPLDFKIRGGKVKPVLRLKPPIALGCDVAGVVEAVGANVRGFAKGDEVLRGSRSCAWAGSRSVSRRRRTWWRRSPHAQRSRKPRPFRSPG